MARSVTPTPPRGLLQKVWDAIPVHGTSEDHEWEEWREHDPEADWQPSREAMKALQARIRKDISLLMARVTDVRLV